MQELGIWLHVQISEKLWARRFEMEHWFYLSMFILLFQDPDALLLLWHQVEGRETLNISPHLRSLSFHQNWLPKLEHQFLSTNQLPCLGKFTSINHGIDLPAIF
jgi:hypothetical protein